MKLTFYVLHKQHVWNFVYKS